MEVESVSKPAAVEDVKTEPALGPDQIAVNGTMYPSACMYVQGVTI